jgi:hypothetical protein
LGVGIVSQYEGAAESEMREMSEAEDMGYERSEIRDKR